MRLFVQKGSRDFSIWVSLFHRYGRNHRHLVVINLHIIHRDHQLDILHNAELARNRKRLVNIIV